MASRDASVAVVGAQSGPGTLLREALAEAGVPGPQVNLYGTTDGEAVISEYAGEARLIQDPNLPEITAHDVIYLCEPGELTEQVVAAAGRASTVVDLIGCLPDSLEARLVHPNVNPEALTGHTGYLTVPHPLAMTLAELLHGVEGSLGIDRVTATLLRPASDFGEPGTEELREQTVRLLNFAEVPTETFGAQLAFNVLGGTGGAQAAQSAQGDDRRIRRETEVLLGWEHPRLALRCLTVPVFYGHGVLLNLRTREAATLADLRQTLATSPFFAPPAPVSEATPLAVAAKGAIVVAEPTDDGVGGFWIWAVAGEAGTRAAQVAVRLSGAAGAAR